MRIAFPLLFAALSLAPVESGADIMKDYLGNWTYEEKWQRSKEEFTLSYTVETKRLTNGAIHTIAHQSVRGKRQKAFEEWLYAGGRAMLKGHEDGRVNRTYTGSWSVKSGRLFFSYALASDQKEWFRGNLKRVTRDDWSGAGTASGGYNFSMRQQRAGTSAATRWLFAKKATAVVPKNFVWSAGEFDLGGNDKVPAYEFYPRKSRLASNSYGTFIFVSGEVAEMDLPTYVRDEVKPWFRDRGHRLVRGSEKWNRGQSWTAETTYVEKGVNYRERMVVWPCREGFVAGTVFGPARDWGKSEFKQMLKVLDSVRIRLKRGS